MEMNTRLQVEHPVTEMITGLDLVEWQLRVAYGEALPVTEQAQLKISGHAFEARIYAEDPQKDFMPSTGVLKYLAMPENMQGIRIDSGVTQGDIISVYYDPMIAKLAAWGEDRDIALSRLVEALEQVKVIGVQTNVSLLLAIARQADFSTAQLDTHYIEKHHASLFAPADKIAPEFLALAALAAYWQKRQAVRTWREISSDPDSPWFSADHWRNNLAAQETIRLREENQDFTILAAITQGEIQTVTLDNEKLEVSALTVNANEFSAMIAQQLIKATILFFPPLLHIFTQGQHHVLSTMQAAALEKETVSQQQVVAPMPGALTEIFVSAGQQVKKGERLLVVEAMKMQHTLYSPLDGVIKEVFFKPGDLVEEGTQLLVLE